MEKAEQIKKCKGNMKNYGILTLILAVSSFLWLSKGESFEMSVYMIGATVAASIVVYNGYKIKKIRKNGD